MTVMTSREFNQRLGQAQKAAQTAPVIITNRGEPALVLINYHEYQSMKAAKPKKFVSALEALTPSPEIAEALAEIEFELKPRSRAQRPPVDFGEI